MISSSDPLRVLIFGSGNLGSVIVQRSLANPKLQVNLMVRDPTKHKELVSQVEAKGGKVFQGDLKSHEAFQEATKGMHTVVSVVNAYDESLIVGGQIALIDAAVKNGVKRYYPVEYGVTDAHLTKDEINLIPGFAWHQKVRDYLKTQPIKSVIVRNGFWSHIFLRLFSDFSYYGDVNQKINFIDLNDLAELIVQTIAQEDFSGDVYFAGPQVSVSEATEIYNKVKGASMEAKYLGSVEDLKAQSESARGGANPMAAILLTMKYFMFSGKCSPQETDNAKFSSAKPTTLEETFAKVDLKEAASYKH